MAERRVRPTVLQPFWNVAGFALGAATALMSEKAAMACTEAVETEIDRHYGEQLEELGDDDPEFAADIGAFRAEEVEHRDTAREAGAAQAFGYPVLTAAIRAACRLAIGLSKRIWPKRSRNLSGCRPLYVRKDALNMSKLISLSQRASPWSAVWRPCRRAAAAQAATGSARSSFTAPTPARARPMTKSSSARASPKERYRIPERFRAGGPRQTSQAWANKARGSKPSARPASTAARRSGRPATPAAWSR